MIAKHKKARLVLLDTHAILHRAYHALPEFTAQNGEPTGALYGLASMLIKLIGDLRPDYIAACYDLPGKTYRHEAYEAYKGKRPKTDPALASQIARSRDVISAFGIPAYESAGFEADDVLGTIVEQMKDDDNVEIIIASGDMDTLQLISGTRVRVYTMKRGLTDTVLYDEEGVVARFGFPPGALPDYKGLRGDPSDNIVGVPGIGEKTASTLISEFGSIEKLYHALKKTPAALKKAGISERVIGILKEHKEEAEFSKMLAQIRRDAPIAFTIPKISWRESVDGEALVKLFQELSFRSLVPRARALLSGDRGGDSEAPEEVLTPNIKPEELKRAGLALWLVDSNFTTPTLDDIMGFSRAATFDAAARAIEEEMVARDVLSVYRDIELPLMPVLEAMERAGVLVDREKLSELSVAYHHELEGIAKQIYAHAGSEFNINSPKQLGDILFETLGLGKNHKKTAGGQRSTRESELQKLKDAHPIIELILQYRELSKLLSTYIDSIPALLDKESRLHTTYLQTGTTTGRLSSKDPNLQNIPIRSDLGRAIRTAFIAPEGFVLLACDYSQIELRVAAVLSGDSELLEIFRNGRDVHAEVAAKVFGVPLAKVDAEMRRRAKVINFGILYGMGVNALQQQLKTSRKEAQEFYNQYFATFSRLAEYLDEVRGFAARHGYTKTLFGRRRYFPDIRSPLPFMRAQAERMAINAPIQGTQSDIIKLAMIRIADYFATHKLTSDARMLLQVHDELLFEIKEERVGTVAPELKRIMESVLPKKETKGVTFAAESKVGKNWGELVRTNF